MTHTTDDRTHEIVRAFLVCEREARRATFPLQQPVAVHCRLGWRVGGIAELRADGICMLAITSYLIGQHFIDALLERDPARLVYHADPDLDLAGRQHVVARVGDRLRRMDAEQTRWAASHIGSVHEINPRREERQ